MLDEKLGVGKQTVKQTERVEEFDNEIAASKARREQYARSKKVAAQEAELLARDYGYEPADEEGSNYDGDDGGNETDSPEPKSKPRAKGKSQVSPPEVDPKQTQLLDLISTLMSVPREQLAVFETSALQALWDQKVGHKTTKSATGSKAAAKPKAKPQPVSTPKAKCLKASVPMKSQIAMVGSPIVALKQGEQELARAMDSPLAERRKRDAPVDQTQESNPKRIHYDTQKQLSQAALHPGGSSQRDGQSKTVAAVSQGGSVAPSSTSVASTRLFNPANLSRASSRAPSGPPSRAGSTAPTVPRAASQALPVSHPVSHAPAPGKAAQPAAHAPPKTESSDIEIPGLGDGTSDEYRDNDIFDEEEEQPPVAASGVGRGNNAGTGGNANRKKERPTTGKFDGVERKIVNRAVECTLCIHSQDGFFPNASDRTLVLCRGWEMAVHDCGEEICHWEINQDHITVIRARVGSFRARGRSRINNAFRGTYQLNITEENSIDQVKEHAKGLYPDEFHRNPLVKFKRAGHYRHPFLAKAVYLVFYTGDKPLATRFPGELSMPTIPMIAVTCTMIEDLLMRYAKDGYYVKDTKGQSGTRSVPKDLQGICARHERNLATFQNAVPATFESWIKKFAEQVRACGGKKTTSDRRRSQVVEILF
ncbi:transmembrane protein [Ceratobasidium sp. AG-Ba]|nr:transmembrane protein [Ceratobasidium sp. AG-Ba]